VASLLLVIYWQLSDGVGSVILNSSSDSLLSYFVYDLLKRESAATDEESGSSDEEASSERLVLRNPFSHYNNLQHVRNRGSI